MSTTKTKKNLSEEDTNPQSAMCGIVMPISAIDGCDAHHWSEVLSILKDAAAAAGFKGELVSHLNESGNIQKEIIRNLYQNEIVICDISGKNPNVMLELGIRLAFDKPTIVVKDDATDFSFDISTMKHLIYRRDLRFKNTISFKDELTELIQTTHTASQKDNYSSFIRSFGEFKILKIDEKQIPENEYIIDQLKFITNEIVALKSTAKSAEHQASIKKYNIAAAGVSRPDHGKRQATFVVLTENSQIYELLNFTETLKGVLSARLFAMDETKFKLVVNLNQEASVHHIYQSLMVYAGEANVFISES